MQCTRIIATMANCKGMPKNYFQRMTYDKQGTGTSEANKFQLQWYKVQRSYNIDCMCMRTDT